MNYIKITITGLIIAFISLLSSCEGDLEPEIFDRVSTTNFFETRGDVNAAVTGIYAEFGASWFNRWVNGEWGTDEYLNNFFGRDVVNNFIWSGDAEYSQLYIQKLPAVTRAGALLEVLKDLEFLNEQEKARFIAEVKTARAVHMYDLLTNYGPCPVILDEELLRNPDPNFKPVRPPLNTPEGEQYTVDYVAAIEKDLKEAIEDLEIDVPSNDYGQFGRFDKGTAMTVLLKLYMHQKHWEQANTMALDIMNLDKYSLEGEYASIWSINNEQNDEIIWAVPRRANINGQDLRARTLTNDWEVTNEAAYNGDKVRFDFYDTFDENDIRRNNIVVEFVNPDGDTINLRDPSSNARGGYNLKYGRDPEAVATSGVDIINLRYADVILCKAEALNEINGPNQESIDLLNEIRNRAGVNELQLSDFTSKEQLRDAILDERGWEFYMEGLRREDLIRHGKYIEYASLRENANPEDFHVLYPIPQDAYNENENITQNPGYDF